MDVPDASAAGTQAASGAAVGLQVVHRRYVPYSHAHYAGHLVDGAYGLARFGDVARAEDGGKGNGMVSFTELSDMLEVEGVAKHKQEGRLMAKEPKPQHEALKAAIKDVK